jgi:hypothetical protein
LPLGVGVRVFDRVADAGLGREVDHAARALALEQLRHGHPVADIDARVHGFYQDRCPVYRSLRAAIAITTELVFEPLP